MQNNNNNASLIETLPADVLNLLCTTLPLSAITAFSQRTNKNLREKIYSSENSAKIRAVLEKKFALHFPHAYEFIEDKKSADWLELFRLNYASQYAGLDKLAIRILSACKEGDLEQIQKDIQQDDLLNLKDKNGRDIWYWLSKNPNPDIYLFLYNQFKNDMEKYPLHWAIKCHRPLAEIMKLATEEELKKNIFGLQPILLAAEEGLLEVVLALDKNDIKQENKVSHSLILHHAIGKGHIKFISAFKEEIENDAFEIPVNQVTAYNDWNIFFEVETDAHISKPFTPLMKAIINNEKKCVEELLKLGKLGPRSKSNLIHCALHYERAGMVHYLLNSFKEDLKQFDKGYLNSILLSAVKRLPLEDILNIYDFFVKNFPQIIDERYIHQDIILAAVMKRRPDGFIKSLLEKILAAKPHAELLVTSNGVVHTLKLAALNLSENDFSYFLKVASKTKYFKMHLSESLKDDVHTYSFVGLNALLAAVLYQPPAVLGLYIDILKKKFPGSLPALLMQQIPAQLKGMITNLNIISIASCKKENFASYLKVLAEKTPWVIERLIENDKLLFAMLASNASNGFFNSFIQCLPDSMKPKLLEMFFNVFNHHTDFFGMPHRIPGLLKTICQRLNKPLNDILTKKLLFQLLLSASEKNSACLANLVKQINLSSLTKKNVFDVLLHCKNDIVLLTILMDKIALDCPHLLKHAAPQLKILFREIEKSSLMSRYTDFLDLVLTHANQIPNLKKLIFDRFFLQFLKTECATSYKVLYCRLVETPEFLNPEKIEKWQAKARLSDKRGAVLLKELCEQYLQQSNSLSLFNRVPHYKELVKITRYIDDGHNLDDCCKKMCELLIKPNHALINPQDDLFAILHVVVKKTLEPILTPKLNSNMLIK